MIRQTPDDDLARSAILSVDAFGEMARRYYNRVYFTALAVVDNRESAEDIAQETFFRVWLMRDKLTGKAIALQPWLTTIARNIAIDWHRKGQQRSRMLQIIPMEDLPVEPVSPQNESPREAAAHTETLDQVNQALHKLSPEMREVIFLHYAEAMSPSDIARMNGEAVSTVTRRLERARQQVREQLESGLAAGIALMKPNRRALDKLLATVAGAAALNAEAHAEILRLAADTPAPILAESAAAAASAGVAGTKAATGIVAGKWMLAAAVAVGGLVIAGVATLQDSCIARDKAETAEATSRTRIIALDSRPDAKAIANQLFIPGKDSTASPSKNSGIRPRRQAAIPADATTSASQSDAIVGYVTITGVVCDQATSAPLPNAEVYGMATASPYNEKGEFIGGADMRNMRISAEANKRTRTLADTAGRYELKIPLTSSTATLALDAFTPGYRSLAGTFTSGGDFSKANIPVKVDEQLSHDLNLPKAAYLAGQVIDEEGKGVPDVEVKGTIHYKDKSGMAYISTEQTDKDGWFEVFDYQTNPWYDATTPSQKIIFAGKLTFSIADRLTTSIEDIYLLDEAARANLKILMEKGNSVDGQVVDAAGNPGTSLPIFIQYGPDNFNDRRYVKTDAAGFFSFKGLPDGEARICVRDIKRDLWENTTVTLPARGDLTLRLHATPEADISGAVNLLGMTLIDMTPELKTKYEQYSSTGVLVLNPGTGAAKLDSREKDILGEGDQFFFVGSNRISNLREFAREILKVNAQPKPVGFINEGYEGYVRVAYNNQPSRGRGSNTLYMNLTPDDIRELENYLASHKDGNAQP